LTQNDLAAHDSGGQLPDPLQKLIHDEIDLPVRMDLTYADPAFDYQNQNQQARRFQGSVNARGQQTFNTPVVLSATQAKKLVERSLAEVWVTQIEYHAQTSSEWATLDPADIISVTLDDGTIHELRLISVQHGVNGVIELQATAYDPEVYITSP
jgi:hypothetical protein